MPRRRRGAVRAYVLALRPNAGKAEAARYAIWWQARFCLDYVRQLYGDPKAPLSARTLGRIADRGLKCAHDIVRAGHAAARATGVAFSEPKSVVVCSEAIVRPARRTSFPLWVKVLCGPWIPAMPHRAFSKALRAGATLRPRCEIRYGRGGGLVARVFVEYPPRQPTPSRDVIGVDVGINHGVTTSDGRTGAPLYPILDQHRLRNAERRRQGHRTRGARTALKQHLDREARRLVTLASRAGKTLAVERLKTLGNLKPSGRIGGWARRHFGERVLQIGEEVGVAVLEVHPAYTSQTCLACDYTDPENRRGVHFECRRCGARGHADVVGARNVARKATGRFPWGAAKAGQQTRSFNAAHRAIGGGAS